VRIQCQKRPGICWGAIDGNKVKLRAVAPEIWSKLHVIDYDFDFGCERATKPTGHSRGVQGWDHIFWGGLVPPGALQF